MLINHLSHSSIQNTQNGTSRLQNHGNNHSHSSSGDTSPISPELQIKQVLKDNNIDFSNASLAEVREVTESLRQQGLISPLDELLMNTPTEWNISKRGRVVDIRAGADHKSTDFLAHWSKMTTIGSAESRQTASVIEELFNKLLLLNP